MATDTGLPETGTRSHHYTAPGTYTATISDESDPTRSKSVVITIPFILASTVLSLSVTPDPADSTGRTALAQVTNVGHGPVTVDFGDGTPTVTHPGDGSQIPHVYAVPVVGAQTITATDVDEPARTETTQFTPTPVPPAAPEFFVEEQPGDPDRRTVRLSVNNPGPPNEYQVRWTAAGNWEDLPATGPSAYAATHKYAAAGTFPVTVRDKNNTATVANQDVTVPYADPPTITVVPFPGDTTGLKFAVTVDNKGQGPADVNAFATQVSISGSPNAGDNVAVTTVEFIAATAGDVLFEAVDVDQPTRRATVTVEVPHTIALTVVDDPADQTGQTVVATVDNRGHGPVTIAWGDGQSSPNPGDGTTTTSHQYAAAGAMTITATDADEAARTATASVTVPYPFVSVVVDPDDATGQSVLAAVDNYGRGPVTIAWGDGQASPQTGDFSNLLAYTYNQMGEHTITVTDDDDPAVTVTTKRTLPLPLPPRMRWAEDPDDATGRTIKAVANNYGHGDVLVDWGDGTPVETHPGDDRTPFQHVYAGTVNGDVDGTITDTDEPARTGALRFPIPVTPVGFAAFFLTLDDSDPSGGTVRVQLLAPETGHTYEVQWDGAGAWTDVVAGSNPPYSLLVPKDPGVYTVELRDKADTAKTNIKSIRVPRPIVVVERDPAVADRTGVIVRVRNDGQPVSIVWGDNTAGGTNAGDGVEETRHTYAGAAPGSPITVQIEVVDADENGLHRTVAVTLPYP